MLVLGSHFTARGLLELLECLGRQHCACAGIKSILARPAQNSILLVFVLLESRRFADEDLTLGRQLNVCDVLHTELRREASLKLLVALQCATSKFYLLPLLLFSQVHLRLMLLHMEVHAVD